MRENFVLKNIYISILTYSYNDIILKAWKGGENMENTGSRAEATKESHDVDIELLDFEESYGNVLGTFRT